MKKILFIFSLVTFVGLQSNSQNVKIVFDLNYVEEENFNGDLLAIYSPEETTDLLTVDSDGNFSGQWIATYPDGQLREYGVLTKNERNGTWMTWNENGVKTSQAQYLLGKKDGEWLIWDDQGNLRFSMYYKNGERTGLWKIYDETGSLISKKKY